MSAIRIIDANWSHILLGNALMMSATGFHIMHNDLHSSWLKVADPIKTRIVVPLFD